MMHWVYSEFTKLTTLWISFIQIVVHWEDIADRFSSLFKIKTFVERRKGEHMNVLEIPQFVKDVVTLCNDLKAAEGLLAPQFPQLVADAQKLKDDGEKLLGISAAVTPAPEAAPTGAV